MIKIIWDYILYPIRYLLRHKVYRYRTELKKINSRLFLSNMKARRKGRTTTDSYLFISDMILSIKYKRFINKWEIKKLK